MSYRLEPTQIGDYVVLRREPIGKGNFALVRLAKHVLTKSRVALKIIDTSQSDPDVVDKFKREARILASLDHKHVIRLYEVFSCRNLLCMALEYGSRGEVFNHLKKCTRMTESNARKCFRQVCSAVSYCHAKGIVHRDLKAENLLLDCHMNLKLCDFGFGTDFESGTGVFLRTTCGSPPYAAPELFLDEEYDGTKSDIWSLGILLYIFVTGAYPFQGTSMEHLRQSVISGHVSIPFYVSVSCSDLIHRILQVQPARRPTLRQIVEHRWCQEDWTKDLTELFTYSFDPRSATMKDAADSQRQQLITSFMKSKGLNVDSCDLLISNGDLSRPEVAIYRMLEDKLRRHRSWPPLEEPPKPMPRRGSRGCITTGEVGNDLSMGTNHISVSTALFNSFHNRTDAEILDIESSEEEEEEMNPAAFAQERFQRRRHTLGEAQAFIQPLLPVVMFPQFHFLGAHPRGPIPMASQQLPMVPPAHLRIQQRPHPQFLLTTAPNLAVNAVPQPRRGSMQVERTCLQPAASPIDEEDEMEEEAIRTRYTSARGKRHTLASPLEQNPLREMGRCQPYTTQPGGGSRRSSNSAGNTLGISTNQLQHLQMLHSKALTEESGVEGNNVQQLQQQFVQLKTNTEGILSGHTGSSPVQQGSPTGGYLDFQQLYASPTDRPTVPATGNGLLMISEDGRQHFGVDAFTANYAREAERILHARGRRSSAAAVLNVPSWGNGNQPFEQNHLYPGVMNSYTANIAPKDVYAQMTGVLNKLGVPYTTTPSQRRLSVESDDGLRMDIGFSERYNHSASQDSQEDSSQLESSGEMETDIQMVHTRGNADHYNALRNAVLASLPLQEGDPAGLATHSM